MRPVIPDDLFTGSVVVIPIGLAVAARHNLVVIVNYLRRAVARIREQRQFTRAEAVHLAAECATAISRLEKTDTALDFGRVRPGDDDTKEH